MAIAKLWAAVIAALWLVALGSALAVVQASYAAREATRELEALRHEAGDLHVRTGQFLLERGALADYARIESTALERLEMTVPDNEHLIIVAP